jgi:DNA-binding CsgD family transcriptional regulator
LGLSEKTIATYKVRVMEKLGLRTAAELIQRFQLWQEAAPAPHRHD